MRSEENLDRLVAFLTELEGLPRESGAYLFEGDGMVLVEDGRVCWAVADDAERTLTMLLVERGVDGETLRTLYRECKEEGRPLGETLVARGLVSADAFRTALLEHTAEAVYRLATSARRGRGEWVPHKKKRYDATFTFGPLDLLFCAGRRHVPEEAEEGWATLRWYLGEEGMGIAFLSRRGAMPLLPLAAMGGVNLRMEDLVRIAAWAPRALAEAGDVDLCMVYWADRSGLATWRRGRLLFVADCPTPSALAWIAGRHRRADQAIAAVR